jgi:hypothetical protein
MKQKLPVPAKIVRPPGISSANPQHRAQNILQKLLANYLHQIIKVFAKLEHVGKFKS